MDNENIWKRSYVKQPADDLKYQTYKCNLCDYPTYLECSRLCNNKIKKSLPDLYIICELRLHCPYVLVKHEQYRQYHSMIFPVFAQTTNKSFIIIGITIKKFPKWPIIFWGKMQSLAGSLFIT